MIIDGNTYGDARLSVVRFHIGRSARKPYGGHKTFVGVQTLQQVLREKSTLELHCENERREPLPDDKWAITDAAGHIILSGKQACLSEVGDVEFNGQLDADTCLHIEDCNPEEIRLIRMAIAQRRPSARGLTPNDIHYVCL